MKRLIYIANCRLPSERAHGLQIMKMCEAFVEASGNDGIDVTLLLPSRRTSIKDDPFQYYGISDVHKKHIETRKLWSLDLFGVLGRRSLPFWIHAVTYSISVWLYVRGNTKAMIFSRDPVSAFLLARLGYNVCYEVHDEVKNNLRNRVFFSRLKQIVVTNENKRRDLMATFGISDKKILVAHNGVSLFKRTAQDTYTYIGTHPGQTDLPKDGRRRVIYTGSLKSWKGVETLARATKFLPQNVLIVFVGDAPEEIRRFKQWVSSAGLLLERMVFQPHVPWYDIPKFWAEAEVLVVPNTAQEKISLEKTSPIKLFEALASRKPVVASDIPSIREITKHAVDERPVAIFAKPDDPIDWAEKLQQALDLPDDQKLAMTDAAWLLAQRFSWEGRASFILEFLKRV